MSNKILKAVNIDWDVDGEEDTENIDLPNEIYIPDGIVDADEISDFLSDETGFCHRGFELVTVMDDGDEYNGAAY